MKLPYVTNDALKAFFNAKLAVDGDSPFSLNGHGATQLKALIETELALEVPQNRSELWAEISSLGSDAFLRNVEDPRDRRMLARFFARKRPPLLFKPFVTSMRTVAEPTTSIR